MLIREVFVAGVPKPFNHPGNYFRIKRVTGLVPESLDCTFFRNGAQIDIDVTKADPGDFAFVPDGFDRVEVVSTVAQTVTVQIARGRVGSDRVVGTVSVVDVARDRAVEGLAFSYGLSVVAAGGLAPGAQLWNPAGSGKYVIVDDLAVSVGGAAADFVLTSWDVVAMPVVISATQAKNPSKGASVTTEIRSNTAAAVTGVNIGLYLLAPSTPFVVPLKAPVILPPGHGLNVWRYILASTLSVSFGHYEEPA
jgi:hypothetical protein